MDHVRTALKAIQWERVKGELRAFVALAGSYKSEGANPYETDHYQKWVSTASIVERFIKDFEDEGFHE